MHDSNPLLSLLIYCKLLVLCWLPRLLTDPNVPGVEKLSVTTVPKEYLDSNYCELPSAIGGHLMLQPSTSSVSAVRKFKPLGFVLTSSCSAARKFKLSNFECMTGGTLLPPFSVGYCKGWKRGTIALICLQAVRELELQDKIVHRIKASLADVHFQSSPHQAICRLMLFFAISLKGLEQEVA